MATIPVPMVTENHLYRNSVRNGHLRRRFTHDGLKLRTTLRQPTLYLDGLRSRCASDSGRDVEFIARKNKCIGRVGARFGRRRLIYTGPRPSIGACRPPSIIPIACNGSYYRSIKCKRTASSYVTSPSLPQPVNGTPILVYNRPSTRKVDPVPSKRFLTVCVPDRGVDIVVVQHWAEFWVREDSSDGVVSDSFVKGAVRTYCPPGP